MKIYMLGGFDVRRGELSPVDQRYMREAQDRSVYVLDLGFAEDTKRNKYRGLMTDYFKRMGATEVRFAWTDRSQTHIETGVKHAGVVYLPGGDTVGLIRGLHENAVSDFLRHATGSVAGNSAGAIALCRDAVLNTDPEEQHPYVLSGMGLVEFSVDPHYTPSHDDKLLYMSSGRVIYGLPEESAIICDGQMEFIGPVWSFTEGAKERVN